MCGGFFVSARARTRVASASPCHLSAERRACPSKRSHYGFSYLRISRKAFESFSYFFFRDLARHGFFLLKRRKIIYNARQQRS